MGEAKLTLLERPPSLMPLLLLPLRCRGSPATLCRGWALGEAVGDLWQTNGKTACGSFCRQVRMGRTYSLHGSAQ